VGGGRAPCLAGLLRPAPQPAGGAFRQAALLDFQTLYASVQWRTYLALHATVMSLAEGEPRDQVQQTPAQSEQGFIRRVAAAWRQIAELFGYRLRPGAGASYATVATPPVPARAG
jgi:hypothetical protein